MAGLSKAACERAGAGYHGDASSPGLALRVRETKRGLVRAWVYRARVAGRQQEIKLGPFPAVSPDDARALAAKRRSTVREDPTAALRSATLDEVIADFRRTHVSRKKGGRPDDNRDTKRRLNLLADAMGKRRIADVRRADVVRFLSRWDDAPAEQRNVRALLRLLWTHAIRAELAPQSMRNVPTLVAPPHEPERVTTQVDAKGLMRIIEAAQRYASANPDAGLCVQTIVLTGCRPAEAKALRWTDVDLDHGTVTWRDRKGGDHMRLPLPGSLVTVLRAIRAARPDDVFVFRGKRGGHLTDLRRPWAWIRKAAKVPPAMRLYDARGSVATLLANTAGPMIATAVLGHADPRTTQKFYSRTTDEARQRGVATIEQAIASEIHKARATEDPVLRYLRERAAAGDKNAAGLLTTFES